MILKKRISGKRQKIYVLRHYFILFVICGLLYFNPVELSSAPKSGLTSLTSKSKASKKKRLKHRRYKKRSYNPSRTRVTALLMIRRYSEAVCELAGLEPIRGDSLFIYDETQDLEDIEVIGDDAEYFEQQMESGQSIVDDEEEDSKSFVEETDTKVDIETFKTLWLSYVDNGESDEFTSGGIHKKTLINVIIDWLGTPYRFGGTTRRAIDCSGFVQKIFTDVCDLSLPRTARIQIGIGSEINREEMEFGDLVFFHTYSYRYASHVGIYLGDGLFAHSSSRYGVTVSSLNSRYYSTHLIGARRLYLNDLEQFVNKTTLSSTD